MNTNGHGCARMPCSSGRLSCKRQVNVNKFLKKNSSNRKLNILTISAVIINHLYEHAIDSVDFAEGFSRNLLMKKYVQILIVRTKNMQS